jgi:hypothetical protein
MNDYLTMKPSELLYLYDAASAGVAHAGVIEHAEALAVWQTIHAEVLRRLELSWSEETSGQ